MTDTLRPKFKRWFKCKKCDLCKGRERVVIGSGEYPADILFIGEAPGRTEDFKAEAFIGRSGRLLRKSIQLVSQRLGLSKLSFYITNTVGCRPVAEDGSNGKPEKIHILSCKPRLLRVVDFVKPKVIIFLGDIAYRFCRNTFPDGIKLYHPAYILRRGGTSSPEYRQFIRAMEEAVKSAYRRRRGL